MKKLLFLILLAASALSAQVITNPNGVVLIPQTSASGNLTAVDSSTNCTTTNACVSIHLPINANALAVQLSGTFSATETFRMSVNNQISWVTQSTSSAVGITTFPLSGQTDFQVQTTAFTSGTVAVSISVTLNTGPPGPAGPGGTGAALAPTSNYTLSVIGSTISATNNLTGKTDFSGADLGAIAQSIITAKSGTCGVIYLKNGYYPATTLNTASLNISSIFAFPSQVTANQACWWTIEGEETGGWAGESSLPVQTSGVLIDVTPTAVSSVSSTNEIACFASAAQTTAFTNIIIKNTHCRMPTNQRATGVDVHYDMRNFGNVDLEYNLADFNIAYNALQPPAAAHICITSMISGQGNIAYFTKNFAVGCNLGFSYQTEHTISVNDTAIFCTTPAQVSANGVFHPTLIENFVDQENPNGISIVSPLASLINIIGLDMEINTGSQWYSRTSGKLTETTPCNAGGQITYTIVSEGGSVIAGNPLFTSGGGCLSTYNSFDQVWRTNGTLDYSNNVSVTTSTPNSVGGAVPVIRVGDYFNQDPTAAAAVTYTLPTPVTGMRYTVQNSDNAGTADTGVLTIATGAFGQYLHQNGVRGNNFGTITSAGAAGDAAIVQAMTATDWQVTPLKGTWTLAGGNLFALKQSATCNPAAGSSVACTFPNTLTNPSYIVVAPDWTVTAGQTVSGCTDTAGNTYVDSGAGSALYNTSARAVQIFKAQNAHATASNVVTCTFSAAVTFNALAIMEVTGVLGAAEVDVDAKASNQTNVAGANSMSSGAVTTTAAADLVIAAFGTQNQAPSSGTSPNLFINWLPSNAGALMIEFFAQVAGAGAITPTAGNSGNDVYGAVTLAVKHQ